MLECTELQESVVMLGFEYLERQPSGIKKTASVGLLE